MTKITNAGSRAGHTQRAGGNPPPTLREGDQLIEVKQGDTMSGLARQHGVSLRELGDANPQVQDLDRIWPGDQLRLPGTEAAPAETPAQLQGDQFDRSAQTALRSQELTGAVQARPAAPTSATPGQQGAQAPAAPEGTTTAAQLATGLSAGGGPLEALTRLAQRGADTVRTYANAAQGRAARVFAEGGEGALRATRAHQAAANLEASAARTAQTASRLRTVGNIANAAAGVLTGIDQYQNSHAQSTEARAVSGVGAGGLAVAVGARHPYFAAADAVANLVGAPDTPSNVLNRSVDTITTVTEGLVSGDVRGMDSLHQSNLRGDNGPVFQAAAEAGDFWADHGVVGGLEMFGDAVGDAAGDLWDSIF